ncbi:hypothetical protein M0R45_023914 [Rubus argutus]|uniref:Uncharacterized protein n=1 Tax=Rubus argutus TaxID=59490 RepID=A0AAW1WPN8_RUBAR
MKGEMDVEAKGSDQKEKDLNDWLPITNSRNATGGTLLSTTSPPWLVLVCLVCPLPCLNLDGALELL